MKPLRTQPYFRYATERLPASSALEQTVAEYLGMRLGKDPKMSTKMWEACIDELISGMNIDSRVNTPTKQRRIVKKDNKTTVADLIYMFQVATLRGWNHVYFSRQQDADWSNISFYQDPYWTRTINNKETRGILEEVLYGESD